ncbi:MAG: helix-turn-helix domain-containing protein [Acetobacter sp.]|uniref:helix-turn-helix domain-containing protein n=1 Tax=Acetobacter sp. TaxID=440 RepID=UPI003F8F58B2
MGKVVPITPDEEITILSMRAHGVSFQTIARKLGRSMETIRQVVLRNFRKTAEPQDETTEDCESDLMGVRECLPVGHPVVMRGLWKGMEQWRPK